jgi:hypothetical protein
MTVNYTSLLSLGQPVTGTESGTWGDDVNNAVTSYLDIAIAGTLTLTGDGAVTLANTQGTNTATNISSTSAQYAILKIVGPLTATKVITAPSTSKTYLVINTDSTYGVTVKASGQTGVTVDANSRSIVVFNGTDYVVAGSDGGSVTFTTVKAGDGTAAAPSYTFSSSGNSDNGMYLPAANSLGFSTAGSERVRVDSSGNVGINTSSPPYKFVVNSATTYNAVGGTASSTNTVGHLTSEDGCNFFLDSYTTGSPGFIGRKANGTSTTPTATTAGNALVSLTGRGYGDTGWSNTGVASISFNASETFTDTSKGTHITFSTTAIGATTRSERMRIIDSGDVGIGTSSPGYRLDVVGSVIRLAETTTSGLAYHQFGRSATATDNFHIGTGGDGAFRIYNGNYGAGSPRVSVTSAGNLGVGVLSPTYKLEVSTDASIYDVRVGRGAGNVASNTTVGSFAMASNTSGDDNTGVGYGALNGNTTGSDNTAFGSSALSSNVSGQGNTAVGSQALISGTGTGNTAVGYLALGVATVSSSGNVAVGESALSFLGSNGGCTAVGSGAGVSSTGSTNTFVGYRAGYEITTGAKNTLIGGYVGNSGGLDIRTASNYIVLSDGDGNIRLFSNNSGEIMVGGVTDRGAYNLQCNGTGVWGQGAYVNGSDARMKENVVNLPSGLDVVKALRPVTFQYKQEFSQDTAVQPGFIAQELVTAMSGQNYIDGVVHQGGEYMGVAYQNLIPILTKAIQEQQEQIELLKAQVEALKV